MYLPKHFEITESAPLYDLMRRFSFATLVTAPEGRPFATHLPFLVYPDLGEHGTLIGHMARSNPQWQHFGSGVEALVIFQGDHTYISPSWYETHPSVPTWNYMVVHAYGVPRAIDDEDRIRAILRELVATHEEAFETPWTMDLPDSYLHNMLRGIVAFEIPILRLEGKFKLSQNRSARDRQRVIAALEGNGDPSARGIGETMRAGL